MKATPLICMYVGNQETINLDRVGNTQCAFLITDSIRPLIFFMLSSMRKKELHLILITISRYSRLFTGAVELLSRLINNPCCHKYWMIIEVSCLELGWIKRSSTYGWMSMPCFLKKIMGLTRTFMNTRKAAERENDRALCSPTHNLRYPQCSDRMGIWRYASAGTRDVRYSSGWKIPVMDLSAPIWNWQRQMNLFINLTSKIVL